MACSNKIFSLSVPRSKKGQAARKQKWRFQDPTAFGDISYAKKVFFFKKKSIIKYPSLSDFLWHNLGSQFSKGHIGFGSEILSALSFSPASLASMYTVTYKHFFVLSSHYIINHMLRWDVFFVFHVLKLQL